MNGQNLLANGAAQNFTAREIALLLGTGKRNTQLILKGVTPVMDIVSGRRVPTYPLAALPAERLLDINTRAAQSGCRDAAGLLGQLSVNRQRTVAAPRPEKDYENFPETAKRRALGWREVLSVYHEALAAGGMEKDAAAVARASYTAMVRAGKHAIKFTKDDGHGGTAEIIIPVFNKDTCTEKTIRNRWRRVLLFGGFSARTPMEAFLDGKSCNHRNALLREKISKDFQAHICTLSVTNPGRDDVASVWTQVCNDWLWGRAIPGLDPAPAGARAHDFPFTQEQFKRLLKPRKARVLVTRGKSAYRLDWGGFVKRKTRDLPYGKIYVVDDFRTDFECLDPFGRKMEVWGLAVMDWSTRRFEGWVLGDSKPGEGESETIVAQVLYNSGVTDDSWLVFERGTANISAATQTLWESFLPVTVHRTSMDGGPAFAGDWRQTGKGHFQGKSVLESSFSPMHNFFRQLPGQRGSSYRVQPPHLGLSAQHKPAAPGTMLRLAEDRAAADLTLAAWRGELEGRLAAVTPSGECPATEPSGPLLTFTQVKRKFVEWVWWHNNNTMHRMEGFDKIVDGPGRGDFHHESPNDKRGRLLKQLEASGRRMYALTDGQHSQMRLDTKKLLVRGNRGATLRVDGFPVEFNLEFSTAQMEAGELKDNQKWFFGAWDAAALEAAALGEPVKCPLHLFRIEGDRKGRYVETLWPRHTPQADDAEGLARELAKARREETTYLNLVKDDFAPDLKKRLDEARENIGRLRSGLAIGDTPARDLMPDSDTLKEMKAPPTRPARESAVDDEQAAALARTRKRLRRAIKDGKEEVISGIEN